jgi:hypothetical protein
VAVVSLAVIFCLGAATTAHGSSEPKCDKAGLPRPVQVALSGFRDLVASCRLMPPLIEGDFDGDGRRDYAVLVIQQPSQERGFLIVFAGGRAVVAGAGRAVKYGAKAHPDLNFDQWELHPKSQAVESAEDQKPLKLNGDALLVSYHESASGLFYWDGQRVRWYQQGD